MSVDIYDVRRRFPNDVAFVDAFSFSSLMKCERLVVVAIQIIIHFL
jgi:hypothetical protein